MTVRKRIFITNFMMVLLSLLALLAIGGAMLVVFKDQFLGWYSDNSQITESYTAAYEQLQMHSPEDTDWKSLSDILKTRDFRLIVVDEKTNIVFESAKHNEEEAAETLYDASFSETEISGYLIEGVTILAKTQTTTEGSYKVFLVSSRSDISIFGMDRSMFGTFILLFILVGIAVIGVILWISQLLTKGLTAKIMEPLDQLNDGALRVAEGNLDRAIAYEGMDEFTNVCNSFDMMQIHLKEQIEQNAAYEKARIEMVSGISHDLRTPLTSIKGYVKGVLDGIANTEEKRQEYLQIAYRKSCDMDRLIEKLFYFSKLETGNMPMYFECVDIGAFLERYAGEKAEELKTRDIRLLYSYSNILGAPCSLDQDQMRRVLDNLLDNACKYAQTDHSLILTLGGELTVDGKAVRFFVKDNGPGLPAEKIQHVFEQFYRGDEARNQVSDGSGLGLYMCRYLVEKHGGRIEASGEDGFCVTITLPIVMESDEEEKDD